MIGFIQGTVLNSNVDKTLVLTTAGVGYELTSISSFAKGETVELYVAYIHRETGPELYAFTNYSQKVLFEFVLQVNGVGPKSAFSVVKNLGAAKIVSAILDEDEAVLKSIPGVGPKTAKQIILDLKTKLEKDPTLGGTMVDVLIKNPSGVAVKNNLPSTVAQEIRIALKELGFKEQEIQRKFVNLEYTTGMRADDILKNMLRN